MDEKVEVSIALASTRAALRRGTPLDADDLTRSWDAIDAQGVVVGVLTSLREERVPLLGEAFETLCRAAATLRAPSIVPILEVGRGSDRAPYCLLELDGAAPFRAVAAFASRERAVPPRVAAWVVHGACGAIASFRSDPRLAVLGTSLDVSCLRLDARGRTRVDPARTIARAVSSDASEDETRAVRALGAVLYELTMGVPASARSAAPGELVAGFPEPLDDAIMSALRASPSEGFATVSSFEEALTSWLESEGSTEAEVATWLASVLQRMPSVEVSAARPPSLRDGIGLGRLLDHKYRLDRVLGSGGMGVVFAATHVPMQRAVAVKVLMPAVAGRGEFVMRFLREARISGSLSHPGLAAVYDVGEDQGAYYLVMELLEGETLRALLDREGALSVERAVTIALPIAAAIAYAHARGVVHRDLKPENVFLCRGSVPKLLDFGISKPLDAEPVTLTGAIIGTPLYLAPEQIRSEAVDARTDVYQLGALLFEMLSGAPPYEARAMALLLLAISQGERARLSERAPSVPVALAELVERSLSLRPEERPPSMRALARDLGRFGHVDAITARELDLAEPEPPRRSRSWLAIAISGVLGMAAGFFVHFLVPAPSEVRAPAAPPSCPEVRIGEEARPANAEARVVAVSSEDGSARCEVAVRRDGEGPIDLALSVTSHPSVASVVAPDPSSTPSPPPAVEAPSSAGDGARHVAAVPEVDIAPAAEIAPEVVDPPPAAGAMRIDDF